MRKLVRRLLTLCPAASLLLCVAACALWARSHSTWDQATWRTDAGGEFEARSASGVVEVAVAAGLAAGDGYHLLRSEPRPEPFDWSRVPDDILGVITPEMSFWGDFVWTDTGRWELRPIGLTVSHAVYIDFDPPTARRWAARLPHWLVALGAALPPLLSAGRRVRGRRRRNRGLCRSCGYDLRATRERCPECGATDGAEARPA
jgi:hypothetical protein